MTDLIADKRLDKLFDETLEGKWVAIAPDYSRIVASAESLDAVIDKLRRRREARGRVPPRPASAMSSTSLAGYEVPVHELLPAKV